MELRKCWREQSGTRSWRFTYVSEANSTPKLRFHCPRWKNLYLEFRGCLFQPSHNGHWVRNGGRNLEQRLTGRFRTRAWCCVPNSWCIRDLLCFRISKSEFLWCHAGEIMVCVRFFFSFSKMHRMVKKWHKHVPVLIRSDCCQDCVVLWVLDQ